MEFSEIIGLVGTPFGLALVGLFLSQWVIAKFNFEGRTKVFTAWIVGIVWSVAMLLAGKYADFGAYAGFDFVSWKCWATFALVALSTGLISNDIFDSKLLEKLLNLLK
jgi:hypothetical protein